ncbi:MAG: hypothetical protein JWP57_1588 [Spirosoma sp.]|nr:hypothetical protein [Spirosoma sp.]
MLDDIYCISQVSFPERIQEIGALRIRAWRNEPGINADFFAKRTWVEAIDHTACHWIITKNNRIVAAARMSLHDSLQNVPYASLLPDVYRPKYGHKTVASINRLVVDPRFRGLGLARLLDQARLDMAQDKGVDYVLAQPQQTRLKALTKLGFSYICELPHIPEMPERQLFFMELELKSPFGQ